MQNKYFEYQVWLLGYNIENLATDFTEFLFCSKNRAEAIKFADNICDNTIADALEIVQQDFENPTAHLEVRVEQIEVDAETDAEIEDSETEVVYSYTYC